MSGISNSIQDRACLGGLANKSAHAGSHSAGKDRCQGWLKNGGRATDVMGRDVNKLEEEEVACQGHDGQHLQGDYTCVHWTHFLSSAAPDSMAAVSSLLTYLCILTHLWTCVLCPEGESVTPIKMGLGLGSP